MTSVDLKYFRIYTQYMHSTEFIQYKLRILTLGGDCTGNFNKSLFSDFIK